MMVYDWGVTRITKSLYSESDMKARYVILGCAVILVLGIITLVVGGLLFNKFVLSKAGSYKRSSPGKPGIVAGQGFLAKSTYLQDSRLGAISDIVTGQLDGKPGQDIGFAGAQGALIISQSAKSFIPLSGNLDRVNIIDVENDGVCEFMNRGSWSCAASLMDHAGRTVWTYGGSSGVDDMAAGDINKDGKLEFAVGFNGGGGIHLVSTSGVKVWSRTDGNVWHVEMVDTNGDGKLEVVHSNAAGVMTIRDGAGGVLKTGRPADYFSHFSLCAWPAKSSPRYALSAGEGAIRLYGYDGATVLQLKAPKCGRLFSANGAPVKLKAGQPEYLAVVVDSGHGAGSILYVYDSKKLLVYQEVLPSGSSIAGLSVGASGKEQLLVGGEGKVWSYTAK